jgi:hypothetical protein
MARPGRRQPRSWCRWADEVKVSRDLSTTGQPGSAKELQAGPHGLADGPCALKAPALRVQRRGYRRDSRAPLLSERCEPHTIAVGGPPSIRRASAGCTTLQRPARRASGIRTLPAGLAPPRMPFADALLACRRRGGGGPREGLLHAIDHAMTGRGTLKRGLFARVDVVSISLAGSRCPDAVNAEPSRASGQPDARDGQGPRFEPG